ncbi:MAG: AAA family ATPase [Chitinophagaceae bacterium]|nr:AAA family ATPase [Chitinophagaceae bacterium]
MIKVVIIGPESTGKSTLTSLLAQHYHTLYCPEYAREYLLTHGKEYTYDDLLNIAKEQVNAEDACMQQFEHPTLSLLKAGDETGANQPPTTNHQLLFIDTDMHVMKVWCEFVFGKCHPFILEQLAERKYDLYLLCNTDLPWVKDELREYPDLETREKLYTIYKDLLMKQPVPWVEISGDYVQRLQIAVEAVDRLRGSIHPTQGVI